MCFSLCSLIWLWAAKKKKKHTVKLIQFPWKKTSQTLLSLKWKQAALVQTPITFWHISMRIHTPEQIKPLCLTNLLPPSSNSILRSAEITSLTTLPISIREERFTPLYFWKSNKMNPHTRHAQIRSRLSVLKCLPELRAGFQSRCPSSKKVS